jgi:hypothetical protein
MKTSLLAIAAGLFLTSPADAAAIRFLDFGSIDPAPILDHSLSLGASDTIHFAPTHLETFFVTPVKGNEISVDGQIAAPIGNDFHVEEAVAFSQTLFDSATFFADRTNIMFGAEHGVGEPLSVSFGTAVPETQTWIMMLAGFGALMMSGRRRRHARIEAPYDP